MFLLPKLAGGECPCQSLINELRKDPVLTSTDKFVAAVTVLRTMLSEGASVIKVEGLNHMLMQKANETQAELSFASNCLRELDFIKYDEAHMRALSLLMFILENVFCTLTCSQNQPPISFTTGALLVDLITLELQMREEYSDVTKEYTRRGLVDVVGPRLLAVELLLSAMGQRLNVVPSECLLSRVNYTAIAAASEFVVNTGSSGGDEAEAIRKWASDQLASVEEILNSISKRNCDSLIGDQSAHMLKWALGKCADLTQLIYAQFVSASTRTR